MIRRRHFLTLLVLCLLFPLQASSALQDVEHQMQAGQYHKALSELDTLLAKDPHDPHLLFARARALAASGRQDKAIQQYEALIKARPTMPEPYNNLAVIYMQQGKTDKAHALLDRAMKTHPAYARIYRNLAALNAAKARDAYSKALQMPAGQPLSKLEVATSLSLPEKPVPSVRPAPVVAAAAKPALVYKAKNTHADKKGVQPVKQASVDADGFDEAKAVLLNWAKAWSTKNVDQYLQMYGEQYSPPDMSRSTWQNQRRERINRPKWIRVNLRNFSLHGTQPGQLIIRLEQEYTADNYSDVTRKEFVMQMLNGQWRIIKERGLGYLTR